MALLLVLWALVVLGVLAAALVQNAKLDHQARRAAADRVRARWLARAGAHQMLSVLATDISSTDNENDLWSSYAATVQEGKLEGGAFWMHADSLDESGRAGYGAVDEAGKVNINTADRDMLLALPNMTEPLADAIVDYRRQAPEAPLHRRVALETAARSDSSSERAEASTASFATPQQLGLIGGFDRTTLFGEDDNLNGILENNEDDGAALAPADNENHLLERGLLAYITTTSYECNRDAANTLRLNINEASTAELEQLGLSINHAKWIEENQAGGYDSIADILDDTSAITQGVQAAPAPLTRKMTPRVAAAPTADGADAALTDAERQAQREEAYRKAKAVQPDFDTFRRIADQITVTDKEIIPGRININTAGGVVLATLPGINPEMAERIIQHRRQLPEGFVSVAELLTVPGMTIAGFKEFCEKITVRSCVFTIHTTGRAEQTGLRHHVRATVDRTPSGIRVLYWRESR